MDEGRDPEARYKKSLTVRERKFLRLVCSGMTLQEAYTKISPKVKSSQSAASRMMSRIRESGELQEFLKAKGLDNMGIADVIVGASKATRTFVLDGMIHETPDHANRLKAVSMILPKEEAPEIHLGKHVHFDIHLPPPVEDEEEWEKQAISTIKRLGGGHTKNSS